MTRKGNAAHERMLFREATLGDASVWTIVPYPNHAAAVMSSLTLHRNSRVTGRGPMTCACGLLASEEVLVATMQNFDASNQNFVCRGPDLGPLKQSFVCRGPDLGPSKQNFVCCGPDFSPSKQNMVSCGPNFVCADQTWSGRDQVLSPRNEVRSLRNEVRSLPIEALSLRNEVLDRAAEVLSARTGDWSTASEVLFPRSKVPILRHRKQVRAAEH